MIFYYSRMPMVRFKETVYGILCILMTIIPKYVFSLSMSGHL